MKDFNLSRVVLRWVEDPKLPWREEPVEMLEGHLSEAIISSEFAIGESTKVQLIGQGYQEAAVVSSCRESGARFILTLRITSAPEPEQQSFQRDPGVFSVHNFLTGDQADKILEELDRELDAGHEKCSICDPLPQQCSASVRQIRFGGVLDQLCMLSVATATFAL